LKSFFDGIHQLKFIRLRNSQLVAEVAACAEQCSQNRPPSTEEVSCQSAGASTTLAAALTTRCLRWHTRLWTCLYHSNWANASTDASTHGRYARRLRHCSSNRSLAQTSRNVLFDAPRLCLEFTPRVCHRSDSLFKFKSRL